MASVELGCPGHFIGVRHCQFRRHTEVNGYRVSTVGEYCPCGGEMQPLGGGRKDFYETMVFRLTDQPADAKSGCGCHAVAEWCELEGERYGTAGEAQAGHERYVRKYARRKP